MSLSPSIVSMSKSTHWVFLRFLIVSCCPSIPGHSIIQCLVSSFSAPHNLHCAVGYSPGLFLWSIIPVGSVWFSTRIVKRLLHPSAPAIVLAMVLVRSCNCIVSFPCDFSARMPRKCLYWMMVFNAAFIPHGITFPLWVGTHSKSCMCRIGFPSIVSLLCAARFASRSTSASPLLPMWLRCHWMRKLPDTLLSNSFHIAIQVGLSAVERSISVRFCLLASALSMSDSQSIMHSVVLYSFFSTFMLCCLIAYNSPSASAEELWKPNSGMSIAPFGSVSE